MKWARWRTLTESTCRTPVRASVRSNVAIVGVAWGRSVKPWAARAIRRAWSCVSWSTRELNQTRPTAGLDTARHVLAGSDVGPLDLILLTACARSSRSPARSGQVEELLAHGVHDCLHAGVELQLLQDVADVVLDRVLGDEQLLGDLLDGGVLEQVAGGTVLDRLVEVGLLVGDGEHDDLGGRHGLLDRATGLDAGAARHPYVEQDHVGRGGDRQLGGGDAVGGLADHLDVDVSTQQHDEAAAEELLVVDDQDADGFGPS